LRSFCWSPFPRRLWQDGETPYLLVGWSWYLGCCADDRNHAVGYFVHADRFTYLPQIGLYVLLTWTAVDLCAGLHNRRWVLAASPRSSSSFDFLRARSGLLLAE